MSIARVLPGQLGRTAVTGRDAESAAINIVATEQDLKIPLLQGVFTG